MAEKGHYSNKGLYNKYDKNHKERDKLDYYATPSQEVYNILKTLGIDFSNCSILEPCCGGGHMINGIDKYLLENQNENVTKIASDIKDRGFKKEDWNINYGLDFFSDDYPFYAADWVVMNPPYGIIEPFTIRALDIAEKGVVMLARLQFLEGKGRFDNIFSKTPPTDVYVYVDRIQCWKDGKQPEGSSAQAYAWFVWDKERVNKDGILCHHLHSQGKI